MTQPAQHERPLTIYCSACADARQLAGDACWHCGATSERSFRYRSYGFVTMILVALLAAGLLLGIAANRQTEAAMFAADEAAAQSPDRLATPLR